MKLQRLPTIITCILFVLVHIACTSQSEVVPTDKNIQTKSPNPTKTSALISTLIPKASSTYNPITSTQQAGRATAIAIQTAERAARIEARDVKETQIAKFAIDCERVNFYSSNISPNENWFAASCEDKENSTLVVQNKEGAKWVLELQDFLNNESPEGMSGLVSPIFWSPDGSYLYFTINLEHSTGGNYCFPEPWDIGDYGLFKLDLVEGTWSTIIPITDYYFIGHEIVFSPTGKWFAISLNGVTIVDLKTGKNVQLEIEGIFERMSWSPDGKYLTYASAICDEENIISSSIYIWDAATSQSQILLEVDKMILRPESWISNSTLRIEGEEMIGFNSAYTIYEYNIESRGLLFSGTETPNP